MCVVNSDGAQRIIIPGLKCRLCIQVAKCPESSRTDDFAELKRQLDAADADIALVNERLDEAQGMQFLGRHLVRGALC